MKNTHYISLAKYKELDGANFLPGDEKSIYIKFGWDEDLIYDPNHGKEKPVESVKVVKKREVKATKPCKNCGNSDKKMLKSKSFFGVRAIQCMRCGYRS